MIIASPASPHSALEAVRDTWAAAWPAALEAWSKFTRLRPPSLCLTAVEAQKEGLAGSFAMIRLVDQAVVVSLPAVCACHVEKFAVEILAHEIGHHVLAPATLTDHARTIARMRWALPTLEAQTPMVANLYTDLLINDRLQRSVGLAMEQVYRAISSGEKAGLVWTLYMRIYEILWSLPRGMLIADPKDDRLEGDAWLGARLIRSYSRDWLEGSGRFASLLLPYLLEDTRSQALISHLLDTRNAADGGEVPGLSEAEPGEKEGAIHPANDPDLCDVPGVEEPAEEKCYPSSQGQARQPFEYGEILRAAGLNLNDHDIAIRYYRERARPHLIPFPKRPQPQSIDPLPEGLEPWDIGQSLDDVDWMQSILQSPRVIPGMTTVQRVWGTSEGGTPAQEPFDLDLYVDSSGSMPNPQRVISFLSLAGAVICLSALRAGARVQATLWSGSHQFTATDGFIRNEETILRVLTGYFGGATAFPIHCLRDTFEGRADDARPAHILVISDDGVSTMFDTDERGTSGWKTAAMALRKARGGGTLVLNLPLGWEGGDHEAYRAIRRARFEQGWNVHCVGSWEDLIQFAREFSRLRYGAALGIS